MDALRKNMSRCGSRFATLLLLTILIASTTGCATRSKVTLPVPKTPTPPIVDFMSKERAEAEICLSTADARQMLEYIDRLQTELWKARYTITRANGE